MRISVIKYNILNLPDTILFANGNRIVNLYDAAGHKYKSVVYTVPATAVTASYDMEHAAQYEKGKVVYDEERGFISNAPEGLVGLEIEAYQTEYSINGYVTAPSDEGDVKSSLDINEDWIKGIRDPITGGHVYNPEADYNNPLGNIHKPWKFEPQKLGL